MAVTINMRELLQAGVHYGHQTKRWNPKMRPYIFAARNGIHIIDLQKTVKHLQAAAGYLERVAAKGGKVLFVGTKRQSRELVAQEATRCQMYYINHRWLGGTLTNFNTIRQSIHRLRKIEEISKDGTYEKLPKKEVLNLERQKFKLHRNLGGIKDMHGMPDALLVIDAHREAIAVSEAKNLGIPVVAITDTNADPTGLDYVVPGNDDSVKSLTLFITTLAEACAIGKERAKNFEGDDDAKSAPVVEGSFYDAHGHTVAVEKKPKITSDGQAQTETAKQSSNQQDEQQVNK
ncbi:MAG: 30S ribosomal protein S2 [Pseudomonadota bacterium]|nr:30S ribosomal protein S2 [Pseudomonadota bacterium]